MLQNMKRMDLHKEFADCLDAFNIRGKDLAVKVGRTAGYVSEVRRGACGISIESFGEWLEACEELAPGFKKYFSKKIAQQSLSDIALMIDSGNLSDNEVAQISVEVADIVVAISRRLKLSVIKKEKVLI